MHASYLLNTVAHKHKRACQRRHSVRKLIECSSKAGDSLASHGHVRLLLKHSAEPNKISQRYRVAIHKRD